MARHPNEFLVSYTFARISSKVCFHASYQSRDLRCLCTRNESELRRRGQYLLARFKGQTQYGQEKQSANLICSRNLQCPLPVESLNLLRIVKVFFPLFRHDHQVLPLLIQSLLFKQQQLIKYSYFTCFDANIIILYDLLGHFIDQSSNK